MPAKAPLRIRAARACLLFGFLAWNVLSAPEFETAHWGHQAGLLMSRIVVMEDEPVLRLTLRHILEEEGHQVLEAENGRIGLLMCRENPPDLVITDLIMPEVSGSDALDVLEKEFPKVPVIAMSGMREQGGPTRKRREVRFVMKPVTPPQLKALVGEMLQSA
jgi:CheY-like chemotaxis protein